ncbi:MAG TPA: hypothetical protein DDZ39_10090 [Flavobacteriaceae bacterium]|nr:hypothetical protein [Flavobacteriaceae bacterium]
MGRGSLFAFIALFTACSTDDESKETQDNLAEETPIAKELVFDNVIVEGATKKAGTPDTPNEQVSFTLNKNITSAVLIDGFDIEFNSNDNIIGAYLQIKDTEGNIADGYYDIDLSKVSDKKKITSIGQLLKQKNTKASITKIVDIDFKAAINPGTFCYVVSVFDASGNTSAPQEVCITVQSWGGNDDLVGNWNFTKLQGNDTTVVDTARCNSLIKKLDTLSCLKGTNKVIKEEYCYITNSFKFTINTDGTYVYEINDTYKILDYSASRDACKTVNKEEKEHYLSKGQWAYDQTNTDIILVELEAVSIDENGEETKKTHANGEAEVTVLKSNITSDVLTLLEDQKKWVLRGRQEWQSLGNISEIKNEYYFDKK